MVLLRLLRFRRDEGAVAVISAILIPVVFIALCSIVIDLGMARDTRRQAQNAADASALAAGNVLWLTSTADITSAVAAVKSYAAKNYGVTDSDWATCTDVNALSYRPGGTPCISFDDASNPLRIRVTAPIRQVATPFAGIWGINQVPVSASAQIGLRSQCGICVLGGGTHDLQNGSISVSGTDVAINGFIAANPHADVTVTGGGSINLFQPSTPTNGSYSLPINVGQSAAPDPLAGMTMPDFSSSPTHDSSANACTLGPGVYDHLTASCTLQPGLYVLTGSTSLSGNSSIVGLGVTLYFVCGTSQTPSACPANTSGGSLTSSGNATVSITAPTSGPTQGLAWVADRNNRASFSFAGNGAAASSGTIYMPASKLTFNGNGSSTVLDSLVVIGDVAFAGMNAAIQTTYSVPKNVSEMSLTQ